MSTATKSPRRAVRVARRCNATEFLWDREQVTLFRQVCQRAFGRDCFCEEGEDCWLMEGVLDQIRERAAGLNAIAV
jgi:hypothetical protein